MVFDRTARLLLVSALVLASSPTLSACRLFAGYGEAPNSDGAVGTDLRRDAAADVFVTKDASAGDGLWVADGPEGADGLKAVDGIVSVDGPRPTDFTIAPGCSCARADVDGNGLVDGVDLTKVRSCIGQRAVCAYADTTGDGLVNSDDEACVVARQGCDASPCRNASKVDRLVPHMVHCGGAKLVGQCDAEQTYCRASVGWFLCTADEYRKYGGEAKPHTAAWIASCVLPSFGKQQAPDNAICPCTTLGGYQTGNFAWPCAGGGLAMGTSYPIGVLAHGACHALGVNTPSTEAYWLRAPIDTKVGAALCCR